MTITYTKLGDLTIIDEPPAKLIKALAVVSEHLHPAFNLYSSVDLEASKTHCVLSALTVRDFLRGINIAAQAVPVGFVVWAETNGRQVHSVGVGMPHDDRVIPHKWNGHLVVQSEKYLIDPTLYQVARPHWPELPKMFAVPREPVERQMYDMDVIAGLCMRDSERPADFTACAWLDNPKNRTWRTGPDGRDASRRQAVVRYLIEKFGEWRD